MADSLRRGETAPGDPLTRGEVSADVLVALGYHGVLRVTDDVRALAREAFGVTDADLKRAILRRHPGKWLEPLAGSDLVDGPRWPEAPAPVLTLVEQAVVTVGPVAVTKLVELGPAVARSEVGPVVVEVEADRCCPGRAGDRGHRAPVSSFDGSVWCVEHRPRPKGRR